MSTAEAPLTAARNANGKIVKDDIKTVVRDKWAKMGRAKL